MSLDRLDRPTRALVALAAAVARGDEPLVEARSRECVAQAVSAAWVDELLLQSLLMCGWPRTLNAAMAWRRTGGAAPVLWGADATPTTAAGSPSGPPAPSGAPGSTAGRGGA